MPTLIKVLFVCDANQLRSPTAEKLFAGSAGFEVRSAGLNSDASVPVTKELVTWADKVFVMEQRQRNKLRKLGASKITCLDIPDDYEFMDAFLVHQLHEKLDRYFGTAD